uniref:Retrovirus-related Pol polyprotein from transposon TNT 1-94 n=1 Tax=Tanacetum cinerariifolium TaxID=118510 RepID=A0A6L2LJM5_TANCI|nr:retrovirus-related Pol polyprotein from transposon TNT 1-94 [Tanacetum cinerariifolium]
MRKRECRSKGNQESRRTDAGNTRYKARDNRRRPAKQVKHKDMVTIDGEGVDWTGHAEDDTENYALMAFNSSNSGSDTETSVKDKAGLGQTVKDQDTCSQNPKVPKRDWTGLMSKRLGLGYGYTRKACFVCGSFSHLIRDCDFHEKRMAKQVKLNKRKNKITCQRNDRPVWNNVQRLNHQNKFVPTTILTKTGRFPVNAARQSFSSQTASTSTVRKVNTARPIVNKIRPRNNVSKSHSPIRRPFNSTTTPKAKFVNHKITTAGDKTVTAVRGNRETVVKTSTGIKREYSNARTPQQNGVAERKNKTLIKAARTMLADSFLPNTFWAEAVSTACYVLNMVLVNKPQNKTPYELITGKIPIISYIRPFGCHVTILNTINHLGKFKEKSDEGFLVGYSLNNKAFRVYNLETKRVEENMHINFLENKPNVTRKGPTWLFDLDYLTDSTNYQPVTIENKANKTASPKEANNSAELESLKRPEKEADDAAKTLRKTFTKSTKDLLLQVGAARANSTNNVNTASTPVNTASTLVNIASLSRNVSAAGPSYPNLSTYANQDDYQTPSLEDSYEKDSSIACLLAFFLRLILRRYLKHLKMKVRNKKDDQGVVVRNKARLVAQRHRREEGIEYDEKNDKEVYVSQPSGFIDPKFPKKKSWCDEFEALMKSKFQMSSMGKLTLFLGLQTTSTLIETKKPLVNNAEAADVDVLGHSKDFTSSCCEEDFQEVHNRRLSISWQETYFMAV